MSGNTKNFFKATSQALIQANKTNNKEALSILKELILYLRAGSYSSSDVFPKLVDELIKGTPYSIIAEDQGIAESTVKASVPRYSAVLFKEFGTDFFENLTNLATTESARNRMDAIVRANQFDMANVLEPAMLRKVLRNKPDLSIDLQDCKEEITFLAQYNRVRMLEAFEKLDQAKFTALVHSLTNKEANVSNPVNISLVRNLL